MEFHVSDCGKRAMMEADWAAHFARCLYLSRFGDEGRANPESIGLWGASVCEHTSLPEALVYIASVMALPRERAEKALDAISKERSTEGKQANPKACDYPFVVADREFPFSPKFAGMLLKKRLSCQKARYEAKAECIVDVFCHSDEGPWGHDAAFLASTLLSLKCKEYGIAKDCEGERAVKSFFARLQREHCLRGAVEAIKGMFLLPDSDFSSIMDDLKAMDGSDASFAKAQEKARSLGIRWEP